ncbi:unnamed protein product, partial [marine sediment metagenome]
MTVPQDHSVLEEKIGLARKEELACHHEKARMLYDEVIKECRANDPAYTSFLTEALFQ